MSRRRNHDTVYHKAKLNSLKRPALLGEEYFQERTCFAREIYLFTREIKNSADAIGFPNLIIRFLAVCVFPGSCCKIVVKLDFRNSPLAGSSRMSYCARKELSCGYTVTVLRSCSESTVARHFPETAFLLFLSNKTDRYRELSLPYF